MFSPSILLVKTNGPMVHFTVRNPISIRLAGFGKALWARRSFTGLHVWDNRSTPRRMLKKARLLTRPTPARQDAPFRVQGRSERRGEEVRTALRVGRSPLEWILANGKAPRVIRTSGKLCSVR